MDEKRISLILEPLSKRILVKKGSTVYETLVALNFPVTALCAGNGTCGKCKIRILDPNSKISDPSEKEIRILGLSNISDGFRLACQVELYGDTRVYLTQLLIQRSSKILIESDLEKIGIDHKSNIQPIIFAQKRELSGFKAKLENDLSQIFALINEKNYQKLQNVYVDNNLLSITQKLPFIIRKRNKIITYYFRKLEMKDEWTLFDLDSGDKVNEVYGFAVDIGTTTIVGYLIHLNTGEVVAISSLLNPQIAIGEDLVSRITYIVKNNAIQKATELVITAINEILEDCCNKAKVAVSCVKDISIVGNTVMHHIFFGIYPEFISISPYLPTFKAPINVSAGRLGINCGNNVNVYSPPVIAGTVGTDTIGCIISSKIYESENFSLLIDIGTNGELVLGDSKGLITASCAAGSALEGAHITHGMRASEGAIESVTINKENLEPSIGIIGNINPIGICGSGLIDMIAEMLKAKVISRAGKFNSELAGKHRRIVKKMDGYHYIIFKKEWDEDSIEKNYEESKIHEISISQKDINQLQLAKAAFLSAANLLLDVENEKRTKLQQVILAGGFGTYINKKNAAFIGLFPEIESNKVFQIGNAAGIGAQLFIRDRAQRNLANDIAYKIKYREIASLASFQKEFTFSLYFPHYDLKGFPSISKDYNELDLK